MVPRSQGSLKSLSEMSQGGHGLISLIRPIEKHSQEAELRYTKVTMIDDIGRKFWNHWNDKITFPWRIEPLDPIPSDDSRRRFTLIRHPLQLNKCKDTQNMETYHDFMLFSSTSITCYNRGKYHENAKTSCTSRHLAFSSCLNTCSGVAYAVDFVRVQFFALLPNRLGWKSFKSESEKQYLQPICHCLVR